MTIYELYDLLGYLIENGKVEADGDVAIIDNANDEPIIATGEFYYDDKIKTLVFMSENMGDPSEELDVEDFDEEEETPKVPYDKRLS